MNSQNSATICLDDYANSMFRFERLHPRWINNCAAYLRRIFGQRLEGRTVIDYAFGRGNWSLAFREAGAAEVISIDGSGANVRRLSDYCLGRGITGLKILHGNVLDEAIPVTGDLIWLHGLLPCIVDVERFLAALRQFARDSATRFHIYSYDADSLRQFVVETCRAGVIYPTEGAFEVDSLFFTPKARLRARDDLTAPRANWHSADQLQELTRRAGLYVVAQNIDFQEFLRGAPSEEFQPHHFLCSLDPAEETAAIEPVRPFSGDVAVLRSISESILNTLTDSDLRRSFAVGLFNCHFSALSETGEAAPIIVQDFLYLFHALTRLGMNVGESLAKPYIELAQAALSDEPRLLRRGATATAVLADFLNQNTIRL